MIEELLRNIGCFIVYRKYFSKDLNPENFRGFINNSSDFLILMPEKDEDFTEAFQLINFLTSINKNVTLFIRDLRVSLIPHREKIQFRENLRYIDYGLIDFSKLYLPSKRLVDILKDKNVDVLIDLNLEENIYCTIAANIVRSRFRICFRKGKSDKFYNFQIVNNIENNSAISYRNLLNSLQMF